jgi:hypothetical protein
MADRASRKSQSREEETRRKPWAPPNYLEAPDPPPGYVNRWIRTALRGEEDKMNVHAKLREGWEPVRGDQHPEYKYPTIEDGKYAGVIGQGGLMLCIIPVETVKERTAHYGGRTREQMLSVDEDLMKEQHPSMPISNNRQSRVTFGGRERGSE